MKKNSNYFNQKSNKHSYFTDFSSSEKPDLVLILCCRTKSLGIVIQQFDILILNTALSFNPSLISGSATLFFSLTKSLAHSLVFPPQSVTPQNTHTQTGTTPYTPYLLLLLAESPAQWLGVCVQ